jgi:heat shock protein HtpX
MTPAGLQTSIWDNNIRSILVLVAYPFVLMAVVFGVSMLLGQSMADPGAPWAAGTSFAADVLYRYWPAILGVVGVWFVISYFWHGGMIRALSHARPVTRAEEPELYNLFENLCISVGIPTPRLNIIETHARNAFASGIDQRSYSVTVTRGLLQTLTRDELEGVLAHELSHILNRDVRLLMVCVIFTGMLGFAAQMVWSFARYHLWVPRDRNRQQGNAMILLLGVLIILWAGYFATILMRFAVSRRREYMADAGAVQMTKNPDAMMRALMRIAGRDAVPAMPADVQMMCIENRMPFLGLFATHPPIEARIKAISTLTATPVPDALPAPRATSEEGRFYIPGAAGFTDAPRWTTRQRFNRDRKNPWS